MKEKKNIFYKDLLWYLLGSALPMTTGFFRVPIFTRYFTPTEYGIHGIVYITYFILSIFLFNWLSNCIWRFYNEYKSKNSLNKLYSNLFILFIAFSFVFLLITIIWNLNSSNSTVRSLTYLIFLQLFLNSINNYILIVFRLEGKASIYNVIVSLRALVSFGLQAYLAFQLHFRIEAIPLSMIIIEILLFPMILLLFFKNTRIRLSSFSKPTIKKLFQFSIPSILSNLGLYLLTTIDRYIIEILTDFEKVGIYNQVYNLCQVSMMASVNLYFAVINPSFLKKLSDNLKDSTNLTSLYLTVFLMFITPIAVYLSLFGDIVANIMLGESFREGTSMIPWLMVSVYFYGLTLFPENRLKFASEYKSVIIGFVSCVVLNIVLNFIAIPLLSYHWAAITTFISYLCLMIYFFYKDKKLNHFKYSNFNVIITISVVLSLQIVIHFILKSFNTTLVFTIIEAVVFSTLYIAFILYKYKKTIKSFTENYS